jgi:beta-galactosidase
MHDSAMHDSYHLYRAHWSRAPMVYIAGRDRTTLPAGPATVKVYTNAGRVTLEVNGIECRRARRFDRVAVWRDVPLAPGRNVVAVRTDSGATDSVVWEGTP